MTFGAEMWGPPLIQAGGSLLSSWLGGKGASAETKMQKTQRRLIDSLLASLNGNGPYSDLYNPDSEIFQKSFVEPAKSLFRNQIAPQIQQQYIASGQQRGTGLDDALTRAGVDLDAMLNQYLYQNQQDALSRKQNAINSILGSGPGAPNSNTGTQDVMQGLSGYLSSSGFADTISNLFKNDMSTAYKPQINRKGFAPD